MTNFPILYSSLLFPSTAMLFVLRISLTHVALPLDFVLHCNLAAAVLAHISFVYPGEKSELRKPPHLSWKAPYFYISKIH